MGKGVAVARATESAVVEVNSRLMGGVLSKLRHPVIPSKAAKSLVYEPKEQPKRLLCDIT